MGAFKLMTIPPLVVTVRNCTQFMASTLLVKLSYELSTLVL